ncbi:MAG: DUF2332 domain-containing protein [Acidimicrobiia bacterium]|nr:DUF2332 domain-containing protein [Acidimicrobiia bacterium]
MTDPGLDAVAGMFRVLAEFDFEGASPLYHRLATAAADDPEVVALLLPAAPRDRMPHLLFAAVQYLLGRDGVGMLDAFSSAPYETFRTWCLDHRQELESLTSTRVNQTNEVGRCAASLPTLATVAAWTRSPLAIVEVGTSAGLNLLLDRYRYVFGPGHEMGPTESGVVLQPRIEGAAPPPMAMPEIVFRMGLDRQPEDVADDDAMRWLRACIWPEQHWRAELFDRAVDAARRDPPTIVRGDVLETLGDVVGQAPPDAALCILHTAFINYLPEPDRFVDLLSQLGAERPLWWVSGEPPGLVPGMTSTAPAPARSGGIHFLYGAQPVGQTAHEPAVLARSGTHGAWLEWLGDPSD